MDSDGGMQAQAGNQSETREDRRSFLAASSGLVMAGGLCAGYGTLLLYAGRYVFPTASAGEWSFVTDVRSFQPGGSVAFESPEGLQVVITRREDSVLDRPAENDFLALSSVCPHLGCRVHWEPQNNRYFCPCHNGVFDPQGNAVSGPPAEEGQELPRYPLRVVDNTLYIQLPPRGIAARDNGRRPTRADRRPDHVAGVGRPIREA